MAAVAAPVHTPGTSADRRYVDWFLWFREGLDDKHLHGAVMAAMAAEDMGADPVAAAHEAVRSGETRYAKPSLRHQELCNWYVWAIDRKLQPDRALEVAHAAAVSVARGMSRTQALDVAMAYERGEHVRLGPPLLTRLTRDPGLFLLIIALAVLVLALFAGLGKVAILFAFVSLLIVPLQASRFVGRFTPMMAIAILVDLAVIVVVAFGIRF
jgi:hypothetical protein